jgi:hypothetical protein
MSSNVTILMPSSDSSDDDDIEFVGVQAAPAKMKTEDDEDEKKRMMTTTKTSVEPVPSASFGSSKPRGLRFDEGYEKAKSYYHRDKFASIESTDPVYQWLYRTNKQLDRYNKFMADGRTPGKFDKQSLSQGLTSEKVKEIGWIIQAFVNRPRKENTSSHCKRDSHRQWTSGNKSRPYNPYGSAVASRTSREICPAPRHQSMPPQEPVATLPSGGGNNTFDTSAFQLDDNAGCVIVMNDALYRNLTRMACYRLLIGSIHRHNGIFDVGKNLLFAARVILVVRTFACDSTFILPFLISTPSLLCSVLSMSPQQNKY